LLWANLISAKEFFFDDFDGSTLKENWEIINVNRDKFIVENSSLTIIASKPGSIDEGNIVNIFRLKKSIPQGDWIITAKVKIDLQTAQENVFLALYDDKNNYLGIWGIGSTKEQSSFETKALFDIGILKKENGELKRFYKPLWSSDVLHPKGYIFSEVIRRMPQPLLLRLQKKGRSYTASAMLEGAVSPRWIEMETFTMLRNEGNLGIGFYQRSEVSGESTANFDWVKIETIE
jgi:hypothetical protein